MEPQTAGSILTPEEIALFSEPLEDAEGQLRVLRRYQRDYSFRPVLEGTVEGRSYWQKTLSAGLTTSPPPFVVSEKGDINLAYLAKIFQYADVGKHLDAVIPFFLERVFTVGSGKEATVLQEATLPAVLTDIAVNQMWFADEVLAERLTDVALNYLALEKDADPGIFAMGVGLYVVRRGSDQQILTLARPSPLTLDSVLKYSRARE